MICDILIERRRASRYWAKIMLNESKTAMFAIPAVPDIGKGSEKWDVSKLRFQGQGLQHELFDRIGTTPASDAQLKLHTQPRGLTIDTFDWLEFEAELDKRRLMNRIAEARMQCEPEDI